MCKQYVLSILGSAVFLAAPVGAQLVDAPPVAEDKQDTRLDGELPGELRDQVSVTATGRPTKAGDTSANTYVLTKQDFRSVGAVNLRDALILVPGVQVP
ncbi:MAG: hypothetical protein H7Y22_00600 [Gemmatimonadaceae bacterium]|nr:hypothetical protein [Gloeobacterales cyanobacterium ES-bin-141]